MSASGSSKSILAANLCLLRSDCGFSQDQIAQKLRINRSTYSYYEIGKTQPSLENLTVLSRIFGVTVDELISVDLSVVQSSGKTFEPAMPFADSPVDAESDRRIDRLVGTTKSSDLSHDEKTLILGFRTLTDDQKRDLLEKVAAYSLRNLEPKSPDGKPSPNN